MESLFSCMCNALNLYNIISGIWMSIYIALSTTTTKYVASPEPQRGDCVLVPGHQRAAHTSPALQPGLILQDRGRILGTVESTWVEKLMISLCLDICCTYQEDHIIQGGHCHPHHGSGQLTNHPPGARVWSENLGAGEVVIRAVLAARHQSCHE